MTFEQQKERYMNDSGFHNLVNMFYSIMQQGQFTIGEYRDALTFAAIKFEMEHIRPIRKENIFGD